MADGTDQQLTDDEPNYFRKRKEDSRGESLSSVPDLASQSHTPRRWQLISDQKKGGYRKSPSKSTTVTVSVDNAVDRSRSNSNDEGDHGVITRTTPGPRSSSCNTKTDRSVDTSGAVTTRPVHFLEKSDLCDKNSAISNDNYTNATEAEVDDQPSKQSHSNVPNSQNHKHNEDIANGHQVNLELQGAKNNCPARSMAERLNFRDCEGWLPCHGCDGHFDPEEVKYFSKIFNIEPIGGICHLEHEEEIGSDSSKDDEVNDHHCLKPNCICKSNISYSSDDDFEDAEPPFEIIIPHENSSGMYIDWDSGLSTYSNNSSGNLDEAEWEDAISMLENQMRDVSLEDMIRSIRTSQEPVPRYPHRPLMFHECEVCMVSCHIRRRYCCDFKICHDCITTYITMKVNEAKVQIECPNDRCTALIHRDEINDRLPPEMKNKFAKFLVDANADPYKKTCPACSEVYTIDPKCLANKKKLKFGYRVICQQCRLQWCFPCQAPYHSDITCKQFRKGDEMVKRWAKERSYGQTNAQRCPKCKIFIQKVHGCDHMKCTRCSTDFCYRCGDRYISIKLLGNHWSRFSLFGCKYRLMPEKPALRRLIRGANFAARLVAGVILAGLGIACGAALVGASVVIVPGYGIFRLKRHLVRRKQLERFKRKRMDNILRERQERVKEMLKERLSQSQGNSSANEESEVENADTQQVQVIVHRAVSFTQEEEETVPPLASEDECEFYINRYTAEGTEVVVSSGVEDSEDVIVVTDVKEIPNSEGYPTVVANIVSRIAADKDHPTGKHRAGKKDANNSDQSSDKKDGIELKSFVTGEDTDVRNSRKISSTTQGSQDQPSCSSENLPALGKSHPYNEGDEKERCENNTFDSSFDQGTEKKTGEASQDQDVSCIDSSGKDVLSPDVNDSTKSGGNGCFGNIFSKRNQMLIMGSEEANAKLQMSSLPKKFLGRKAATWEKCRRDAMQNLLKSSAVDQTVDVANLNVATRGSKTENKVLGMLNGEVKTSFNLEEALACDADGCIPESDINLCDISVGQESENTGKDLDTEFSLHSQINGTSMDLDQAEILKAASHNAEHPTLVDGCYISEFSAVTYL